MYVLSCFASKDKVLRINNAYAYSVFMWLVSRMPAYVSFFDRKTPVVSCIKASDAEIQAATEFLIQKVREAQQVIRVTNSLDFRVYVTV